MRRNIFIAGGLLVLLVCLAVVPGLFRTRVGTGEPVVVGPVEAIRPEGETGTGAASVTNGVKGGAVLSATGDVAEVRSADAESPAEVEAIAAREERATRVQNAILLAGVKTPKDLVEYVRKTGDVEGANRKLAEFIKAGARNVDELAKALTPEDGEDVVMFVVMGMVDAGTEKAVKHLLTVFEGLPENSDIKRDVGEIIITVTNTAGKKLFMETMITSTNSETADVAQRALANMADKDVMVSLVDGYLTAEQGDQKQLYADTIRHMRNPAIVPALIYVVQGEKSGSFDMIGLAACDTLGIIGTREATDCLLQNLKTPASETTLPAVYDAVIKISNPASFDILLEAAKDANVAERVRLAAITALKNYDYSQVGQSLREIADGAKDSSIREAALKSLAKAEQYRTR